MKVKISRDELQNKLGSGGYIPDEGMEPEEIIQEVIKKYGEKFRKTELVEFIID